MAESATLMSRVSESLLLNPPLTRDELYELCGEDFIPSTIDEAVNELIAHGDIEPPEEDGEGKLQLTAAGRTKAQSMLSKQHGEV